MSELDKIENKVDSILNKIDSDIKRKKNSMVVSIIGGVILLIVVFIYFGWIKGLIGEVMEPRGLMLMARDKIQTMLPEISKELETSLKAEAPNVARASREQLLKTIPDGRIYLESQFIMKTEEALTDFVGEFDRLVSDALTENRASITGFMRDVSDPVKKEKLVEDIYSSLKEQFNQPYIKADLDSYTQVLIRLNKKIKFLYEGKDLTEEEVIIRDIIFALRELASRGAEHQI